MMMMMMMGKWKLQIDIKIKIGGLVFPHKKKLKAVSSVIKWYTFAPSILILL